MNNGVIDDYGTHEELLSRGGRYEALVKIQHTGNDGMKESDEYKTKMNEIETDLAIPCKSSKVTVISLQKIPEENFRLNQIASMKKSNHGPNQIDCEISGKK